MTKWIRVEDRLPKIGILVLFYTKLYTKEIWQGVRWNDEWEHIRSCQKFDNSFVTHWQPLPDKPVMLIGAFGNESNS